MLKTKIHDAGVSIFYDGHEFSIVPITSDLLYVLCVRRGEWDEYMPGHTFRTFADVCSAIFYGTIAVERTECGRIEFDRFGNIAKLTPLSYYDTAAEITDLPMWAWSTDECNEILI